MSDPSSSPAPGPVDARAWVGHPVTGPDGRPLGRLAEVHPDPRPGHPAWGQVDDGAGGAALVPLQQARHDGSGVRLPYTAAQLAAAPLPGPAGSPDHLAALRQHYGSANTEVVRHEERLRVGVETVVSGRVRVRRRLVTERRTITVPVTREEITVEYEDVPAGPPIGVGAPGSGVREEVLELVAHEERVLVTTEVVPVERVRVVRHVVTTPQAVGGTVRREVVDVDEEHRAR